MTAKAGSPLKMSKLIERISQIHYIPIYETNREKRRNHRELARWHEQGEPNQHKPTRQLQADQKSRTYDFPSTYLGIREPLSLPKIEEKRGSFNFKKRISSKSQNVTKTSRAYESPDQENMQAENYSDSTMSKKRSVRNGKLTKLVAVNAENKDPVATLHLPRIMKSFVPNKSRIEHIKHPQEEKSSWIDLTSNRTVKQVAPTAYKTTTKIGSNLPRVALVTVNYETTQTKLPRRPLPPLNTSPTSDKFHKSNTMASVWLPADSHRTSSKLPKTQRSNIEAKSPHHVEDAKSKALEAFLNKLELEEIRKSHFPSDSINRASQLFHQTVKENWESSSKPKVLPSRNFKHKYKERNNRRVGMVFNKLQSDLGNYQGNLQHLQYGKEAFDNLKEEAYILKSERKVVLIPTGRPEETLCDDESEIDEDRMNHYFMRRLGPQHHKGNDVRIRYAHRSSNETPTLDDPPWEEKDIRSYRDTNMETKNLRHPQFVPKKIRRLTVTVPRVPPPSPERQILSGSKKQRAKKFPDECKQCKSVINTAVANTSLQSKEVKQEPPHKVQASDVHKELVHNLSTFDGNIQHGKLKVSKHVNKKDANMTVKNNSTYALTEKLVIAHGAMKKRHKCPKKEVIIAPFTVAIDEKSNESSKNESPKRNDSDHNTDHNVAQFTKPFTFSYIPSAGSANKKMKSSIKSSEKDEVFEPQICNNPQKYEPSGGDTGKRTYISSFVPVNQSKQIYQAIKSNSKEEEKEPEINSLDKATGCEGLLEPSTPAKNKRLKSTDRPRIKLSKQRLDNFMSVDSGLTVA